MSDNRTVLRDVKNLLDNVIYSRNDPAGLCNALEQLCSAIVLGNEQFFTAFRTLKGTTKVLSLAPPPHAQIKLTDLFSPNFNKVDSGPRRSCAQGRIPSTTAVWSAPCTERQTAIDDTESSCEDNMQSSRVVEFPNKSHLASNIKLFLYPALFTEPASDDVAYWDFEAVAIENCDSTSRSFVGACESTGNFEIGKKFLRLCCSCFSTCGDAVVLTIRCFSSILKCLSPSLRRNHTIPVANITYFLAGAIFAMPFLRFSRFNTIDAYEESVALMVALSLSSLPREATDILAVTIPHFVSVFPKLRPPVIKDGLQACNQLCGKFIFTDMPFGFERTIADYKVSNATAPRSSSRGFFGSLRTAIKFYISCCTLSHEKSAVGGGSLKKIASRAARYDGIAAIIGYVRRHMAAMRKLGTSASDQDWVTTLTAVHCLETLCEKTLRHRRLRQLARLTLVSADLPTLVQMASQHPSTRRLALCSVMCTFARSLPGMVRLLVSGNSSLRDLLAGVFEYSLEDDVVHLMSQPFLQELPFSSGQRREHLDVACTLQLLVLCAPPIPRILSTLESSGTSSCSSVEAGDGAMRTSKMGESPKNICIEPLGSLALTRTWSWGRDTQQYINFRGGESVILERAFLRGAASFTNIKKDFSVSFETMKQGIAAEGKVSPGCQLDVNILDSEWLLRSVRRKELPESYIVLDQERRYDENIFAEVFSAPDGAEVFDAYASFAVSYVARFFLHTSDSSLKIGCLECLSQILFLLYNFPHLPLDSPSPHPVRHEDSNSLPENIASRLSQIFFQNISILGDVVAECLVKPRSACRSAANYALLLILAGLHTDRHIPLWIEKLEKHGIVKLFSTDATLTSFAQLVGSELNSRFCSGRSRVDATEIARDQFFTEQQITRNERLRTRLSRKGGVPLITISIPAMINTELHAALIAFYTAVPTEQDTLLPSLLNIVGRTADLTAFNFMQHHIASVLWGYLTEGSHAKQDATGISQGRAKCFEKCVRANPQAATVLVKQLVAQLPLIGFFPLVEALVRNPYAGTSLRCRSAADALELLVCVSPAVTVRGSKYVPLPEEEPAQCSDTSAQLRKVTAIPRGQKELLDTLLVFSPYEKQRLFRKNQDKLLETCRSLVGPRISGPFCGPDNPLLTSQENNADGKVTEDEKVSVILHCPKGHSVDSSSHDYIAWFCDVCMDCFDGIMPSMRCVQCNFDLCLGCVEKIYEDAEKLVDRNTERTKKSENPVRKMGFSSLLPIGVVNYNLHTDQGYTAGAKKDTANCTPKNKLLNANSSRARVLRRLLARNGVIAHPAATVGDVERYYSSRGDARIALQASTLPPSSPKNTDNGDDSDSHDGNGNSASGSRRSSILGDSARPVLQLPDIGECAYHETLLSLMYSAAIAAEDVPLLTQLENILTCRDHERANATCTFEYNSELLTDGTLFPSKDLVSRVVTESPLSERVISSGTTKALMPTPSSKEVHRPGTCLSAFEAASTASLSKLGEAQSTSESSASVSVAVQTVIPSPKKNARRRRLHQISGTSVLRSFANPCENTSEKLGKYERPSAENYSVLLPGEVLQEAAHTATVTAKALNSKEPLSKMQIIKDLIHFKSKTLDSLSLLQFSAFLSKSFVEASRAAAEAPRQRIQLLPSRLERSTEIKLLQFLYRHSCLGEHVSECDLLSSKCTAEQKVISPEAFISRTLSQRAILALRSSALRAALLPPKLALPRWLFFALSDAAFLIPAAVRIQAAHFVAAGARNELAAHVRSARLTPRCRLLPIDWKWDVPGSGRIVEISRLRLLSDARRGVIDTAELRIPPSVRFAGEVGTGKGPTAQFFTNAARALEDPSLSLWRTDAPPTVPPLFPAICPDAATTQRAAVVCFTLGALLARAYIDGLFVPLTLSPMLVELLIRSARLSLLDCPSSGLCCGRCPPLRLADIALLDASLYASVKNLVDLFLSTRDGSSRDSAATLTTSCDALESLEVSYVLPGGKNEYELCPGGAQMLVKTENFLDYAALLAHNLLYESVRPQIDAFITGFSMCIPLAPLQFLRAEELNAELCGLDRDSRESLWTREELQSVIVGSHGYSSGSPIVCWLPELLLDWPPRLQEQFLEFGTGSPRLPPGGLRGLNKITVVRRLADTDIGANAHELHTEGCTVAGGELSAVNTERQNEGELAGGEDDNAFLTVNTCFFYIKLPSYSSKAVLNERLIESMNGAGDQFCFS